MSKIIAETIPNLCGKWWDTYNYKLKAEQKAIDDYIYSNRRVDRDRVMKNRTERRLIEEFLLDLQSTHNFKFPKRF